MFTTAGEEVETYDELNTTGPYRSFAEIENFIVAFETLRLPKPKWTHQAHLIVALWYNLRHGADEALGIVRQAIRRYNEAVGTENTARSGYHETITVFYMWAVRKHIESAGPRASIVELANQLLGGKIAAKSFPFEYYSHDLLLSVEARAAWVAPDLKALE
jgi:hypothetical protein